ncbi:MAG: PadR family transcriptional regulator [Ilumatobacteraceae bacterium]
MARVLTTTSHALLGLLAVQPWTTYELAKQTHRSLEWFWPRAERKLYDEPKHLVAAGLATATEERTGNRRRTVYAITRAGRAALRRWLGQRPQPPALEFEAMVKVFFADGGSLEQLRVTLDVIEEQGAQRTTELRSMIDEVDEVDDGTYPFAERLPINALALRYQLDHEQLQVQWARWAKEQVGEWRTVTDTAGWDWRAALAGATRPVGSR